VDIRIAVELVDDGLDDAVEEVLTAGHIAVQGHRLDAEIGSDPTHGEVAQPVRVDVSDGGGEHACPRQRPAV
jgi:hypothetical protein